MTAISSFAPPLGDVCTTSPCTHQSISPGLDHVQCRNCRRCWPSWHPDYERLLNQPVAAAPEQNIVLEQIIPVAPEQNIVLEQITSVAPEQKHWVEAYSPSNRKHCTYYRYMWMEGRKLCRCHIPGSTKGINALARKTEVERAIAAGWWPSEIEELIHSWRQK